jgi:hypothetical protein
MIGVRVSIILGFLGISMEQDVNERFEQQQQGSLVYQSFLPQEER